MSDNLVSKVEKSEIWDVVLASGVLGSSKNQLDLFKYLLEVKFNEAVSDIKRNRLRSIFSIEMRALVLKKIVSFALKCIGCVPISTVLTSNLSRLKSYFQNQVIV